MQQTKNVTKFWVFISTVVCKTTDKIQGQEKSKPCILYVCFINLITIITPEKYICKDLSLLFVYFTILK